MPRYRVVDGGFVRADGSVAGVGEHIDLDVDVAAAHVLRVRLVVPDQAAAPAALSDHGAGDAEPDLDG